MRDNSPAIKFVILSLLFGPGKSGLLFHFTIEKQGKQKEYKRLSVHRKD